VVVIFFPRGLMGLLASEGGSDPGGRP
jgi:hypothetical protein